MVNSEARGRERTRDDLLRRASSAIRPPGVDVAAFAALLAINAWTGGEFSRLELSGNALHLSEVALALIGLLAVVRLGPRRSLSLLLQRAAPVWLGLLLIAGAAAGLRGLADFGLSATVYDFELLVFLLAVPVVVLVADSRSRAEWLLGALVIVCGIATALFYGAEAVARANETRDSLLADQEGEIGTGAFYACLSFAACLPLIARSSRFTPAGIVLACTALLLIGLADKRTAWIAAAGAAGLALLLSAGHRKRLAVGVALLAVVLGGSFVVNSATEVEPDGPAGQPDAIAEERELPEGPLEGDFERGSEGWRSFGAASHELSRTAEWSADGKRSLHVEGVAAEDDETVYAFACGCCEEGGGMKVEPKERYAATAVVRAREAPASGVGLQLIYYADDGTFNHVDARPSRERASPSDGATTLTVRARAPAAGRIVGIRVGPEPLAEGERASFDVDRVTLREAGAGGENLECGGGGDGDEEEGPSQVEREVEGLLGGTGTAEGENVAWRVAFWRELGDRLAGDPVQIVTGAGFGPIEFVRDDRGYDFRVSGSDDPNNTSGPHNAFVGVLYQTGIVGLVGLVGLLAAAGLRLVPAVRGERGPGDRLRATALAGMLLVAVAYMCFTEALRAPELGLFAWTVVGLSLALWPREAARDR